MSDVVLYDGRGRPMRKAERDVDESVNEYMRRMGVTKDASGSLVISPEAVQRMHRERMRQATMTSVPSTPKYMTRDASGIGVRKGHNRFATFSLESLRQIREQAPIIQVIHNVRAYQYRRMARRWSGRKGEVGFRIVHRDYQDRNRTVPDDIEPFIRRAERIFECPSARYCPTFGTALGLLGEDMLTINRPVVEVLRSAFDASRIVGFRPVDGALIWPTLLWLEKWKQKTPGWFRRYNPNELTQREELDLCSEAIGWDVNGADYCMVRDGVVEAVYEPGKLLVAPIQNRTDINVAGYPPSHVEQAIEIILGFINTWDYNADYFTKGMMAEFILGISADVHPEDVDSFIDQLRESSQGVRRAHQPPIMQLPANGVLEKIDMKPTNREMMFETWLSLLVSLGSGLYRMHVASFGAKPWSGGSGPSLSEGSESQSIQLAQEEGLQGDLQHLAENIFTPLAKRFHPDLIAVWEYGDHDPQKEATVDEIRSRVSKTRNQVRLEQGDLPLGFWIPDDELRKAQEDEDEETLTKYHDNIWNWPTDQTFAGAKQQQAMAASMAEQEGQEQPEDPDGYGGGEGGEDPNGFGGAEPQYPYGEQPPGMAPQQAQQQQPPQAMEKARRRRITHFTVEDY